MLAMSEGKYACWRKSSYSNDSGNCVEATSADRIVAIRDTKQAGHGPLLEFPAVAWRRFLAETKIDKQDL
jgi:hypothetical protein